MGRKLGKAKKQAKKEKREEWLRKRDPQEKHEKKVDDRDKPGYDTYDIWEENIYYDLFYKARLFRCL